MREKDLRFTVLWIIGTVLLLCFAVLYILARIDAKSFLLLFIPVTYVFDLYHKATPGEKLTILYLPVGGIIGWFLKQWLSKK